MKTLPTTAFGLLLPGLLVLAGCRQDSGGNKVPTEGGNITSLGSIRSALSVYYGDHEGKYPAELSELTAGGRYLSALPELRGTPHAPTDETAYYSDVRSSDTGRWGYVNEPASKDFGTVWVDCTHTDMKERNWTQF
ncbi:MAG: hypothetical protein WC969_12550 [Elusimicrobiota bacterium]|jgi:hypothetical protein